MELQFQDYKTFQKNGKWGILNTSTFDVVAPCVFDKIILEKMTDSIIFTYHDKQAACHIDNLPSIDFSKL